MYKVIPTRCEGCIHLQGVEMYGIRVMDKCYVYDCTITGDMLKKPCKYYCKPAEVE